MALSVGLAPTLFPQTTGCFAIQLREPEEVQSYECRVQSLDVHSAFCVKMVGGAGNAPVVTSDVIFFDTGFTDRQPEHLPFACRAVAQSWQEFTGARRRLHFATVRQLGYERRLVAGVGVAPTEAELMRLA